MTKYSLFLLLSSLGVSTLGLTLGTKAANSLGETWGDFNLREAYDYNESLYLSEINVTVDGVTTKAKPTLTYPSGYKSDLAKNVLSESGLYEVTYSAVIGNKFYEKSSNFKVSTPYYTLGEKSSSYYGIPEGATHEGLVVNLAKNETLNFNPIIDLTSITKSDQLFRFYLAPSTFGAFDLNQLIFTLTDVADPTNYFEITVGKYTWMPNENPGQACILGKGDNCDRVSAESWNADGTPRAGGAPTGMVVANSPYGANIELTFNGMRKVVSKQNFGYRQDGSYGWISNEYKIIDNADIDATEAVITYDYKEAELGGIQMKLDFNGKRLEETTYKKAWDFNDPFLADKVSGGSGIWRGFTSGKVRLSVRGEQYENSTAKIVFTDIYGINLKQSLLADDEGPDITIDKKVVKDGVSTIRGKAKCYYTIPDATAYDQLSGPTSITYNVYKNYGTNKQVNIDTVGNKFYPKTAGTYVIEYASKDYHGNVSFATATVYIDDASETDISVKFIDAPVTSTKQGMNYKLPEVSTEGGKGEKTLDIYAIYNSEIIPINGNHFVPENPGDYTMVISAVDYIGQSGLISYKLKVAENKDPFIFTAPLLERRYIGFGEYVAPSVLAYQYTENGKVEITPKVEVEFDTTNSSGGIEHKRYVLNQGETFNTSNILDNNSITFKYVYNDTTIETYTGNTLNGVYYDKYEDERAVDFKKYFISESAKDISYDLTTGSIGGYKLISKGDDLKVKFANKLLADQFAINFYEDNVTDFESIEVTLTDTFNTENKVTLYLNLLPDRTFLVLCGDEVQTTLKTKLDAASNLIAIAFNGSSFVIGDNDVVMPVSAFDNGTPFSPFTGHKLYLDFNIKGLADGDSITLKKIGNHTIETAYDFFDNPCEPSKDYVKPQYYIEGDKGKYGSLNESAQTDMIYAQDVFAPTSSATVTLKDSNGNVVKDITGQQISSLDASNRYTFVMKNVEYLTASYSINELFNGDSYWINKNTARVEYPYAVIDSSKPVLILTYQMHTATYVGGTLILSTFRAEDNVTAAEDLIIRREMILPSGRLQEIPEKYTKYQFNEAGIFEYRIVVIDEAGNVLTYSTFITVYER